MPSNSIGVLVNLPDKFQYLIEPALQYGRLQFDSEVDTFLEIATEEEIEKLGRLAEKIRINGHLDPVLQWVIHEYPMTEYEESANLCFLIHLLDAIGFEID